MSLDWDRETASQEARAEVERRRWLASLRAAAERRQASAPGGSGVRRPRTLVCGARRARLARSFDYTLAGVSPPFCLRMILVRKPEVHPRIKSKGMLFGIMRAGSPPFSWASAKWRRRGRFVFSFVSKTRTQRMRRGNGRPHPSRLPPTSRGSHLRMR